MLFTTGRMSLLRFSPHGNNSAMMMRTMASIPQRRRSYAPNKKKVTTTKSLEPEFPAIMKVPSQSLAMAMPTSIREMDNQSLITLAAMQDHDACIEMLIRHIMSKDQVTYVQALTKFDEIEAFHRQGMSLFLVPYQLGIATAVTAAFASAPLCFHLPTVHWFNLFFVTTQIPEPDDLETMFEVGSWAWNWMEPPLGQISFFLLCLQFSRAQLENLGIRPYTRHIKQYRINRLFKQFPQYDQRILAFYSKTAKLWH